MGSTRRALLVLVALAGEARAEHPLVEVTVDPCTAIEPGALHRVLAVELGGELLAGDGDRSADHTRVSVACTGELAALRVDDPITGKSLERAIDLRTTPAARPRLLALAIVELISASWTELATNPAPRVPPAAPAVSHETRAAALRAVTAIARPAAAPPTHVGLAVEGLAFSAGPMVLGGALELRDDLTWRFGLHAEARYGHGRSTVSLGTVSVDELSGILAASARPVVGQPLHVAAGACVGAVELGGSPSDMAARGHAGVAPWGGVVALATYDLAIAHTLTASFGVEAGYVVLPAGALVAGKRELAIDGAWFGLHAGIGVNSR